MIAILVCGVGLVYSFSSNLTFTDYSTHISNQLKPHIPENTTLFCDDIQSHTNCTLLPSFISPSSSMETVFSLGTLFTGFWTTQFIQGIAIMTIAGTIGKWYFLKDGEKVIVVVVVMINRTRIHLFGMPFVVQ